jgi:hypothetical protein
MLTPLDRHFIFLLIFGFDLIVKITPGLFHAVEQTRSSKSYTQCSMIRPRQDA